MVVVGACCSCRAIFTLNNRYKTVECKAMEKKEEDKRRWQEKQRVNVETYDWLCGKRGIRTPQPHLTRFSLSGFIFVILHVAPVHLCYCPSLPSNVTFRSLANGNGQYQTDKRCSLNYIIRFKREVTFIFLLLIQK